MINILKFVWRIITAKPKEKVKLYRILVLKNFFDTGYGLTSYIFKIIAVMGITTRLTKATALAIVIYTIFCFIAGVLYFYYRLPETQQFITNKFDPFVADVKKQMGIKHNKEI